MKFETTAKILSGALTALGRVIEARNTIPVLGTVQFDSRKLRGTNFDVELSIDVPAAIAHGKTCIAHRPLAGLVRHIPADETVRIEGGKDGATVTFSGGRYDLPCLPASDFPDPFDGETNALPFDGEAFRKSLAFAAPFISTEETRYYLNGICVDGDVIVATDGHRLGCHPLGFDGAAYERCIIPRGAVGLLGKLPAATSAATWKGKLGLTFTLPGAILKTRTIDGTFPDWRRILPKTDGASALIFNRAELASVIARLRAVSAGAGRGISIAWDADHVAIIGKTYLESATAREYLTWANASGKPGVACYQTRFIQSVIGSLRSDAITMYATDSGSPSLWRGDGEAYAVVMPMRGADDDLAAETLEHWRAA